VSIAATVYSWRWLQTNRHKLSKKNSAIAFITLLAITVVLAVTGRAHWLIVLAVGLFAGLQRLLPLLIRFFPLLKNVYKSRQAKAAKQGNQSQVRSEVLLMSLDHDSNQLDGEVLTGQFKGKGLSELDDTQLKSLFDYCLQRDGDSAQLLRAYLKKRFGQSWQFDDEKQYTEHPHTSDLMNRPEALSILGLSAGASDEEIVKAHRILMQKLHPGNGGSDYLAAKINESKRVLLGK
jgi:hypothetical protein